MKVKLIFPSMSSEIDLLGGRSPVSEVINRLLGWGRSNYTPPLSLLMLAAVTPPGIEVQLVDERLETLDFDDPVDLVGVSVVTYAAPRAYQVAAEYRQRGVKVVFGGIHPSALPKEAALHADALVLGEGESAWVDLLADFQRGALQAIYRGRPQMDLDALPFPRRSILPHPEKYLTTKVLTATRGCPNTCTFCSAGVGLLKKYRKRSMESVIAELEQVPGKLAIFFDDNIGWEPEYAKALFRAMIPLHLRWYGELSANALDDPELVDLAAQSGCFMLGVGFESISPQVITSIRKTQTNHPERYAAQIRRLQNAGIVTWAGFMLGFDDDDLGSFSGLAEFIERVNLEIVSLYLLTPFPGSVLFRQYDRQDRLLHKDWGNYEPADGACVFLPKQMTPAQLMDNFLALQEQVYSLKAVLGRLRRSPTWFSMGSLAALHLNLESRSSLPELRKKMEAYKRQVFDNYSGTPAST
ncbi:MAG: radical SAM protein [Chloroflexota bacterium]